MSGRNKNEITAEILKQNYFKEMDNSDKVLFLLKNFGPQNFTSLVNLSKLSKSTVSKYLKIHLQEALIEKKIVSSRDNRELIKYALTEIGDVKSSVLFEKYDDDLILINKINYSIHKLSNLIRFYEDLSVDEGYIKRIIRIISKLGDRFFTISQNEELYMALFFMFINSARTFEFKMEMQVFCEQFAVKPYDIKHYINKIMASDLGFYMFERSYDVFFFHTNDTLGTNTLRLIKDTIIDELINLSIENETRIDSLDVQVDYIAGELLGMGLIWEKIRPEFELLLEKIFVKSAFEMGFPKDILIDLIHKSKKFNEAELTTDSLYNILKGSEEYMDLNLVSSFF